MVGAGLAPVQLRFRVPNHVIHNLTMSVYVHLRVKTPLIYAAIQYTVVTQCCFPNVAWYGTFAKTTTRVDRRISPSRRWWRRGCAPWTRWGPCSRAAATSATPTRDSCAERRWTWYSPWRPGVPPREFPFRRPRAAATSTTPPHSVAPLPPSELSKASGGTLEVLLSFVLF